MNKKYIFISAIGLQICILLGIIGNFEYSKLNGHKVYVEVTGYDPVDIFRGDYVNIAYKLNVSDAVAEKINSLKYGYNTKLYIIPKVEDDTIIDIVDVLNKKPDTGELFFEGKNIWIREGRDITVLGKNNIKYRYSENWCSDNGVWKQGMEVNFESQNTSGNVIFNIIESSKILQQPDLGNNMYSQKGNIVHIGNCEKSLTFNNPSVNRFFVTEGTGLDLEEKIRKGGMLAKWSITKKGKIILLDIVAQDTIK